MRSECIEAVTRAAQAMGRKVTSNDLKNIEDNMKTAMRNLARKDPENWIKKSKKDRVEEAAKYVTDGIIHDALKKKQSAETQIVKDSQRATVLENMQKRGLDGVEALSRFTWFSAAGNKGVQSVESIAKAHAATWKSQLSKLWDLEHNNLYNYLITNKQGQADFIAELYGKDSGNKLAKDAAKQYKDLLDKIITDMNNAGFDVANLSDYRSPQAMSWWKVYRAVSTKGKIDQAKVNEVVKDWMSNVDRSKYVNENGSQMSDEQVEKFLREALTTIYSDGYNKPTGKGSGSLANRHTAHRQLHWKDADSFMGIMERYSETNPIDAIWGQMDRMGKELAIVEKFGPKARDGFYSEIRRLAESGANKAELDYLTEAFESFVGTRQGITNPRVHRAMSQLRNAMSAALLGSNTISQLADQATLVMTARAMNVPALNAFKEQMMQLSSSERRELARSLGFGLEQAAHQIARVSDSGAEGFFGKAANAVLTVNLSNALTNATRSAFGITMLKHIGSMTERFGSLKDIHPDDLRLMEDKGVTQDHWNLWKLAGTKEGIVHHSDIAALTDEQVLKASPAIEKVYDAQLKEKAKEANRYFAEVRRIEAELAKITGKSKEENNARFGLNSQLRSAESKALSAQSAANPSADARASDLAKLASNIRQEAITQLMSMTLEETHMASLQPSFLSQRPKAFPLPEGEFAKVLLQFKSFPLAYMTQHFMDRATMNGDGLASKWKYRTSLVALSTILGGMALILGDIAAGRDPRKIYDENDNSALLKFGLQAAVKGGGMGILGDMLNPETLTGQDPTAKLAGPGVGQVINFGQVAHKAVNLGIAGVAGDEAEFKKTKNQLGAETSHIVRGFIPGQNLWWGRAAFNNLLMNEFSEFLSPGYKDRLKGATAKNFGSELFISDEGIRTPNFDNMWQSQ